MNSKLIIAGAVALPIAALGLKTILKSGSALVSPQDTIEQCSIKDEVISEISDDEAAKERSRIMRELGAKGGRKSKRGKAKPKEELASDGVPT